MSQPKKPFPFPGSPFYSYGSNNLSAEDVFRERTLWNGLVYPSLEIDSSFDFWSPRLDYYGTVNSRGNAIYPTGGALKQLRYSAPTEPLFALNFVADAWRDFSDELSRLRIKKILSNDGPYANMRVVKAWRSPVIQYHEYMTEILYPAFSSAFMSIRQNDQRVKNFDTFLKVFSEFADTVLSGVGPLTLSGFLEGNTTSPLNSGLVLEISDDPHDDDFNKQTKFFYDINFPLVRKIATQYGFSIDRNAPWRFVIDPSNRATSEYVYGVNMSERGVGTPLHFDECGEPILNENPDFREPYGYSAIPGLTHVIRHAPGYIRYRDRRSLGIPVYENIFDGGFIEAWQADIEILKVYLLDFYNRLVLMKPFYAAKNPLEGICQNAVDILIGRSPQNVDIFETAYRSRWKLKTFYLLRTAERNVVKTQQQKKRDIQQLLTVHSHLPGGDEARYTQALAYAQQNFIGPLSRPADKNDATEGIATYGTIVNP
jgi:hypothetical protein